MRKVLASILCVLFISSAEGAGWFRGDGVKVTTVKADSPDEIKFTGGGQPASLRVFVTNQIEIVAIKDAVTNNRPQAYIGSWNLNSSEYYSELHAAAGKYGAIYNGNGNIMLFFDPSNWGTFNAPSKGFGYGTTVGGWDQNGMFATVQLGGNVTRDIYILPALDAATNAQARVAVLETDTVKPGDTNGWEVSSHASLLTGGQHNVALGTNIYMAGNVGIGTYTPRQSLDVAGSAICSTQYLYYASATNCAGVWMDQDDQYVFKIKAGVYSAITNAIP